MSNSNSNSKDRSCSHIKVTGVPCNSPALRGEQFCYFHQNAHRGVRRPPHSRLHPIAMIEDEESIQYALMEVINALMRNTIDVKRATLIIRALHIAVKNASRVKFGIHAKDTVTQIPDYAAPTPEHEAIAEQCELPAVSAMPYKPVEPANPHFWEYHAEGTRVLAREAQAAKAKPNQSATKNHLEKGQLDKDHGEKDHVGTGAFARPAKAKPSQSVGSQAEAPPEGSRTVVPASAPAASVAPAASAVPPHNFKKPPETVKAAPKERRNAAPRIGPA